VNKKEAKKTLLIWPVRVTRPGANAQKFFGSFFQKRTACFRLLSLR
jgi:hypothetical protein